MSRLKNQSNAYQLPDSTTSIEQTSDSLLCETEYTLPNKVDELEYDLQCALLTLLKIKRSYLQWATSNEINDDPVFDRKMTELLRIER